MDIMCIYIYCFVCKRSVFYSTSDKNAFHPPPHCAPHAFLLDAPVQGLGGCQDHVLRWQGLDHLGSPHPKPNHHGLYIEVSKSMDLKARRTFFGFQDL